jgi:hypothetical protein
MIKRTLMNKMISLSQKFQVITLTGPRQSGKTTLVKATFPHPPMPHWKIQMFARLL